jgi:hypothetical protein
MRYIVDPAWDGLEGERVRMFRTLSAAVGHNNYFRDAAEVVIKSGVYEDKITVPKSVRVTSSAEGWQ